MSDSQRAPTAFPGAKLGVPLGTIRCPGCPMTNQQQRLNSYHSNRDSGTATCSTPRHASYKSLHSANGCNIIKENLAGFLNALADMHATSRVAYELDRD